MNSLQQRVGSGIGAQPAETQTGPQPIDPQPVASEMGTQPVDAHLTDSEMGKQPVETQPMAEPLPTTGEQSLDISAQELSASAERVADISVPLVSDASEERMLDSSLEEEEVRVSKVVAGNRKYIPPKKNRLEPLKMDMSKPVVMPVTSAQLSLQCLDCHIIFSDHKSKERHMKQSHPVEYEQCMLGDALFFCYVCDRQFTKSTDLMVHQRGHTEKQPFKCPICDEAFSRSSELTLHKKAHFGQNGIPCSDCGKLCKTLTLLKYHRRTHSGEKPYVCKECGKQFIMPESLQKHLQSHLLKGAKGKGGIETQKSSVKYPCSVCKSTFKTSKTRLNHMKHKHAPCTTQPAGTTSAAQQGKPGTPIIAPAPMCHPNQNHPNVLHLEPIGPLQRVDNIDTEQIRKLIESLGNVQKVNRLVVLGQVPPHAQPLNLQRIQCIGEPLQLHLTHPQIELVEPEQKELRQTEQKETGSIELEQSVMHCEDMETTITLEPVVLDDQMENPSLSDTHECAHTVTVEPQQTQAHEGEIRPEQLPEPIQTGCTVEVEESNSVNQAISQSETAELEQAPEQTVVLELTSLVPTLELEETQTVQQGQMSASSLLPTIELEQTSEQPLIDQEERMSVPALTPTVELETPLHTDQLVELPTSSLIQTMTLTQTPPEPSQTDQGQGTTSHTVEDQVHSTLETDSATKSHEIDAHGSTEKPLVEDEETGELDTLEKSQDCAPAFDNTDVQPDMLQAALPPPETKQIKQVSQLPLNMMSVQEFVKLRKRKQANLQLQKEATQKVVKPAKRQITKKGRLDVKFGPKEKEQKSKTTKPPQPCKVRPEKKLTEDEGETFVSTQQEKKVPLKQKAGKEKDNKKQADVISKSSKPEVKSSSIVHDSQQVQQLQGKPRKKIIKRQKDLIGEGSEPTGEQVAMTPPQAKKKKQQKIRHDGQPDKTKAGKLPRKGRKRKLKQNTETSPSSAEMPNQQITQESLLLLKGHKQPQLKVYKLDVAQTADEAQETLLQSQTNCVQSKINTPGRRKKAPKTKPLKMLTAGVKKKVGRPKKNEKTLSLLMPLVATPASSETQPTKSKTSRKRKAPANVETEGVISSHSRQALECNDCGERFAELSSLQGHKAATHAVESPGLTYADGNIFEGVTGSDLCRPPKVTDETIGNSMNQNTFGVDVTSDWDMEVEVGEMALGDRDGRLSFPALNPSPSLPLATAGVEADGYRERHHQGPPEHSTPSRSPGLSISDEAKTRSSSSQPPPHLTPIAPFHSSHRTTNTETGAHLAGYDKPERQDSVQDTHDTLLPPGCTSEHQVPIEEDIKDELLLEVDLVTVGEQNEKKNQGLVHNNGSETILADSQIPEGSSCGVESAPSPLAQGQNEKGTGTRSNSQTCSSSTEQTEVKQEEEEILVQRKEEEERKGVGRKNIARGRRRGSGRGRRGTTLRGSLDRDGLRETESEKDSDECQLVLLQRSPTNDSEIKDEVEASASQTCLLAAPSPQPDIGAAPETRRDAARATSAANIPSSPEDQVVFELESVTTSVEEVLKSEEGLEGVGEQDREAGQSPGIILERFLTSRQRDGGDEEELSHLSSMPRTSQSRRSLEQHMNDPQVTQGHRPTKWRVEQVDIHNAPGLQTDMGERTGANTVVHGARQCIFYPVKQEESEVLLESSQSRPGVSGRAVPEEDHPTMPTRLYERNPAEEYEVTRVRGAEINEFSTTGEDDLDTDHQNTPELREFLLQSSDDEDSDVFEFSDSQPDAELLVMANFQEGQNHGRPHPSEIPNNLSTPENQAPSRPRVESSSAQRVGEGNVCLRPIDYFLKYLGWDTWADIAICTNKMSDLPNPVTAKEVCQFVGIHIAMGTLKFPSLRLYWQDSTRVPLIADAMSASRFAQLSRKMKLASPAVDDVKDVRHDRDVTGTRRAGNSACGTDKAQETSADPIAGTVRTDSDGHNHTGRSQARAHSTKGTTPGNSIACGKGQRLAGQQNSQKSNVKIDPLWRVRPLLDRIQAGCLTLAREGDHGVDQYPINLTARAVDGNNRPSLHSTVLLGSSGMILHLDLNWDLSDKEGTVEKMVPRGGMVFLCKQELSTPAMLERLLVAGVRGAGKVGGARGEIGDEYVSSDGKLMLRRSHNGFILSTEGKGQHNMTSLINDFEKAQRAARLNRDLCNLYRIPHSDTAPSCWPQVVLWYLTDVALVNSWLHYRKDHGPGSLNLMAFRLEVSKALILSSGSDTQDSVPPQPPAQTLHTLHTPPSPGLLQEGSLPDAAVRYDGSSHWPEQVGEGEGGRCRFGGCERTSRVRCLKCCVFLCISRNHNCFLNFHNRGSF